MLVRGTFVHTPHLFELEILHDHLLSVDKDGVITHFESAESAESLKILREHTNVPFLEGTGLDLPLMQWLDSYALKAELRVDEDSALARRVYTRLASRLRENGTGTVLLFGTIKEETNLILAECMQSSGIRAFVGKLSMDIDISSPESSTKTYIEPSATASLAAARSFVSKCRGIAAHLPESQRLTQPVLTPRFVPTCTDELLRGLGELSQTQNVRVQSHLAEAKDQVEWVRSLRGIDDIDVFDKESPGFKGVPNSLLSPHTVQAHCTFLTEPDFDRLFKRGTSIAHCPLSNMYFSAKPFPLREALDHGVEVGLGTDVAGGYSLDIMSAMRQAVAISRVREGQRQMDPSSSARDISINWKESIYLATRGGARALGLQGMFAVGAPFDAQEIRLYDPTSGTGYGPLDYFDLESERASPLHIPAKSKIEIVHIEKWWCIGDMRNRGTVWVQGNKVVS